MDGFREGFEFFAEHASDFAGMDPVSYTHLDYVWKYVFVCWTGRVPYTYLQSVLGETSVGEWLSFIPGCLIFTDVYKRQNQNRR